MYEQSLTPELISNPQLWRLGLEVREHSLEIVIVSRLDDNTIIYRSIALDENGTDRITAISKAVYDNPLILSDFGRTDILLSTEARMIVPNWVESEETGIELMRVLWPNEKAEILTEDIAHCNDHVMMSVEPDLLAFLRRTFPLARIQHRLTPIVRYFYGKDRLNRNNSLYVYLSPDMIDILYIKQGKLHIVNTFKTPTADDMAYYILLAMKTAKINASDDRIVLCGAPEIREKVAAKLRSHSINTMPVIFPSGLLAMGRDAFIAPFELIILPLCE